MVLYSAVDSHAPHGRPKALHLTLVQLNFTFPRRHYAEYAGYWQSTEFVKYAREHAQKTSEPIEFYDSVTGVLLFRAPVGRSMEDFLKESASHGWPSFRDQETNWDQVRCLKDGECVSTTGTHLGHNLPDRSGNRYCIVSSIKVVELEAEHGRTGRCNFCQDRESHHGYLVFDV